jgi:hypothetical protein
MLFVTFAPAYSADYTVEVMRCGVHECAVFSDGKTEVTISWHPIGHWLRPGVKAGQNLTKQETLDRAQAAGHRIHTRGKVVIDKETYERARRQAERLKAGGVGYRVFSAHADRALNCRQAVREVYRY